MRRDKHGTSGSRGYELEPISPQKAVDLYIEERREDAAYETMNTIQDALELFVEWCESEEMENLNELTGRRLTEFKSWCKSNTQQNKVSLNGTLSVLRRFLVSCVEIEAVWPDVPNKVPLSTVPDDEDVSYEKPSKDEVKQTLRYLEKYEYASRRHVEYAIIEEIGNRVGALRGIDIDDIDIDEQVIVFRHRPEKEYEDTKGTPLKNGSDGQREVNIPDKLVDLIRDYLESPERHDVTDKFGREPLLTSESGRVAVTTIRRDLYKLTRPCEYTNNCPHGREIDTCTATKNEHASECPSSYSPHPLRRFSIEKQIDSGVPKDILSDRVDVSVPVLNKHYDTRKEERKRKQRLPIYEKLFEDYGDEAATLTPSELDAITNDDDMIDPVKLNQIARDVEEIQSDSLENGVAAEAESRDDKDQLSLDNFTEQPNAIGQPALLPVIGGMAIGQWVPDRLRREMAEMIPESENSIRPSPDRAAKGAAAYACYVIMLAVNLSLIGLFPI